ARLDCGDSLQAIAREFARGYLAPPQALARLGDSQPVKFRRHVTRWSLLDNFGHLEEKTLARRRIGQHRVGRRKIGDRVLAHRRAGFADLRGWLDRVGVEFIELVDIAE